MKNLLLILSIVLTVPAFASCPIGDGQSVCSIQDFRKPYDSSFNNQPVKTLSTTPNATFHPLDNSNLDGKQRDFSGGQNGGYNSNCQFGVCLPDRSMPLFQQTQN